MKKFLASFIAIVFLMGTGTVEETLYAQDEQVAQDPQSSPYQPSPYQQNQQPSPYPNQQLPPGPSGPGDPNQQTPGQTSQAQSPDQQPGAARVSYIHGDVSTQRGDNGQWVALTVNTPIVTGDRVATGHDARTEVQLDFANVLRMSNDATANIANLNRTNIQVQIGQGLVTYSVLRGSEAQSEIDTPNAAVHPLAEGDYRIQVNSNEETKVIIRSGSADVSTPQGSTHVDAGQMITVEGTDNPQYRTDPAPGRDEWDNWNSDRDRTISNAASWQHTDRYYTGTQDLDQYGTWSEIPDYGPVWTPQADPGWAPYRAGRWVYEPYYGWTWVSNEPWGWAPYHYGRWMVYGGSWRWWPGPIAAYPGYYPIWAPAYVSFLGFGGGGFGFGFGIGFGFGGGWGRIGWLPVGPGDWFHPWYGGWGGRYGVVGVADIRNGFHEGFGPMGRGAQGISNMNEALRNDRVRAGMSSMAGNEFGRGAVSGHQEAMSAESFRQGSMMTGRMPVSPSRGSFSATDRAASASTIRSASSSSQHFFSSSRAGAQSFGNNSGRTSAFSGASRNTFTSPSNASRSTQGFGSNTRGGSSGATGNAGGWQHFTPPSHESQTQSSARSYSSTESRGGSYGGYSNSSRPALNMRQPIVTPRSGSSYGGGSYNRSYGGSGYGANTPRGSYSAPRSSNAPRSYSAPRGGGSRGGSSRGGSHGGGHSR